MKNESERLYEILGQVDDEIVERTDPEKIVKTKKASNFKWLSIAACLVLVTVIGVVAWNVDMPKSTPLIDDNITETDRVIQPPADESYIKTYEVNNGNSVAEWLNMEELLIAGYVAEFTVIGEAETESYTYFDEEYYNLVMEDMKNNGVELTEEEHSVIKENNTRTITNVFLPVEYEKIYPSEDAVTSDLSHKKICSYISGNILEESFVEGAKFLVITWDLGTDANPNIPVLKEYVFYIDSVNRLTPVFDIPTLEGYNGYTVDEFIEEVTPLFEKGE